MNKKVLIVDDSALVRKQLKEIISTLDFEIDFAKNGLEAVEKATSQEYDVITMDINMPLMNGIEALKIIMKKQPTAVLLISSLAKEDAEHTIEALELGAIDFIAKPGTLNVGKIQNTKEILYKVGFAAQIPKRRLRRLRNLNHINRSKVDVKEKVATKLNSTDIKKIVLVGASTGGPKLIEQICAALPVNYQHPVCIVQHMPANFISSFVERLNRVSALNVYETAIGMEIAPGNIYIARGGVHMNFMKKVSNKIVVVETENKTDDFFVPSINQMMNSALEVFEGDKIIGVLLSGIGDDGAEGMLNIKKANGFTFAESENSATVYGMPRVAYEKGAVCMQLDFSEILKNLISIK